jgi:class 3 adenylate cyclase
MFSGSVGSLETRLDYSILGEPLKKAAKYEALTIQNPSFPLVVGVDIAENLAKYGLGFNKIDSKGQDFIVYSLDAGKNDSLLNKHGFFKADNDKKENNSESSDLSKDEKVFSLQSGSGNSKKNNILWLTCFVVFIISILITLGANFIYLTSFENLKLESDKECLRLLEQLNSNEVLKSSFEALCFDFYEDLYNVINSQNSNKNKIELIENIAKKYKDLKKPIPMFCCLLSNTDDKSRMPEVLNKGFEPETAKAMASYTWYRINDDGYNQEKCLKQMLGEDITNFSMRSIYNRRSALATIDGQDIYLDTECIYDVIPSEDGSGNKNDQSGKLKSFIFCGMPKDMQSDYLADYYKVLAGKSILLALNKDQKWVFSESYTEKEKRFLKENYKNINTLEKEKGYLRKTIDIGDKTWDVYIIKKDLALYYRSKFWLSIIVFLSSIFLLIITAVIVKKIFIHSTDSVAGKLKVYIITFTILPLIVVGFVSYLYVSEDYNVNKSEIRLKLNKLMDEIENKELYYQPLYLHYLDKVSKSDGIVKRANIINACKNDEEKQLLVAEFNNYLEKNVVGAGKNTFEVDPFFFISEVIVSGKNDWTSSIRKPEWADETSNDTSLSETGKFISTIGKTLYLNNESLKAAVGNEMSENLVDTLASLFGAEFAIKFTNSPKELVLFSASFATIGFYTSPMPFSNKVDYILQAFLFFKNEFKPHICELKNNDKISLVKHYKTGSKDGKLFCFYSPNICVGEYFFYNDSYYPNPKEELHTVKELGLASSWINSSFVPVSRTVNLFGPHFLEARKGNIIADNVYAAISSEVPIREKAYLSLIGFGFIIIVSLIMIYCIAQNIILDLLAPITKLMEGAKSAAREDYSFRANFIRKDELGILCESFDKMMKGLEEKQLMNRMVSKTALKVSANVADVESKKINVVLLYVSVPGFDKIMKTTPILELFTALRKQVADISEIVINNGGDIDKIMGEKMLIAFHINDKNTEDIAVQACKVAHMIESSEKLSFKVSVGVNYGQVISGFLGVGEKRDFTIIGDPVNVAARIAVFGEKLDKDKCLISESIYYYINSYIKADLYGEVELKGKSQAMKVYQLV